MLDTRESTTTAPDKQLLAITISIRVLKSIRCYVNDYACFIRPKDSVEKSMDWVTAVPLNCLILMLGPIHFPLFYGLSVDRLEFPEQNECCVWRTKEPLIVHVMPA